MVRQTGQFNQEIGIDLVNQFNDKVDEYNIASSRYLNKKLAAVKMVEYFVKNTEKILSQPENSSCDDEEPEGAQLALGPIASPLDPEPELVIETVVKQVEEPAQVASNDIEHEPDPQSSKFTRSGADDAGFVDFISLRSGLLDHIFTRSESLYVYCPEHSNVLEIDELMNALRARIQAYDKETIFLFDDKHAILDRKTSLVAWLLTSLDFKPNPKAGKYLIGVLSQQAPLPDFLLSSDDFAMASVDTSFLLSSQIGPIGCWVTASDTGRNIRQAFNEAIYSNMLSEVISVNLQDHRWDERWVQAIDLAKGPHRDKRY